MKNNLMATLTTSSLHVNLETFPNAGCAAVFLVRLFKRWLAGTLSGLSFWH
jgi:hypothetical protein